MTRFWIEIRSTHQQLALYFVKCLVVPVCPTVRSISKVQLLPWFGLDAKLFKARDWHAIEPNTRYQTIPFVLCVKMTVCIICIFPAVGTHPSEANTSSCFQIKYNSHNCHCNTSELVCLEQRKHKIIIQITTEIHFGFNSVFFFVVNVKKSACETRPKKQIANRSLIPI